MPDTVLTPPDRRRRKAVLAAEPAQPIGAVTQRGRRRHVLTSSHSRTVVVLGGVPETVVARVEQHGTVDWRPLAAELEGLSIAAGGQLDVKRFLLTPHVALRGRTPLEALDTPAAVPALAELANERIRAWRHARVARRPF